MYKYINKFKAVEEIDKEIELIRKNKRMAKIDKEYFMCGLNHAKLIVLGMEGESLRSFFVKKPEEEKFIALEGYKSPEETTTDILINKYKKDLEEIKKAMQAKAQTVNTSMNNVSNNLTSSKSTIMDADIAEESSNYIQAQILQQAAATLLSTANQSPSIVLQLL